MKKNLLRSIGFLGGLAIILIITSILLKSKEEIYNVLDYTKKVKDIEQEEENSIDVIFIGDSEVYSSYIPLQLFEEQGFTSYVMATYAQRLCDTYALLRESFKVQKPQKVIIESNCFFRYGGFLDDTGDLFLDSVMELIPAMKYHSKLKNIILRENSREVTMMKGFVFRTGVIPYVKGEWMHETEECADIEMINLDYIEKIYNMCRENGAEIIFITSPSPDCQTYERHNAVKQLAAKYGIDYIDMNMNVGEIMLDWNQDTLDEGNHLNYKGAFKTTKYIGKILKEKYNLPDHREDEKFENWLELCETVNKKIDKKLKN